jgi:cysteine-rich repeat protein
MRTTHTIFLLSAAAALFTACSGDDGASATDSATAGTLDPTTTGASTTATTTAGSASATDATTSAGTDSNSASDSAATTTTAGSESDSATTTDGVTEGTATTSSTTGTTAAPDPVCGDGLVEGDEECDDANADDSDECLSTCKAATCGDGLVQAGVEECDDGNTFDKDFCSNACAKVPCEQQEGMDQQAVLSYIWIANSSQNTVSKVNTKTGVEEGRYRVAGGSPSRTSVNLLGDVAVSSRDPGAVTKIAAKVESCVDKNNDGLIFTSTGPNDIKNLGEDECVLWTKTIPSPGYGHGPRATAWEGVKPDPDTCQYPPQRLWFGWKDAQNQAHFMRVDGETGATLDEVIHPWGTSYSPYGGAVDADGNFYASGLSNMPTVKINAQTLQVTDLGIGPGCKYGMTLDAKGDIWVGSCGGNAVYHWDHLTNIWSNIGAAGGSRVNGIMADAYGNVWGAGSNPCRLVHIDAETRTYVNNNIPVPGCNSPWGVSIDAEGYVWLVDMSASRAFKIDPDTYELVTTVTGLVGPYTYSDMTGTALALQVIPQ